MDNIERFIETCESLMVPALERNMTVDPDSKLSFNAVFQKNKVYQLIPHKGIGDLKFGMTPNDILGIIGTVDTYSDTVVRFDLKNKCEKIYIDNSIFEDGVSIQFRSIDLINSNEDEVYLSLSKILPDLRYYDTNIISRKMGLTLSYFSSGRHKGKFKSLILQK